MQVKRFIASVRLRTRLVSVLAVFGLLFWLGFATWPPSEPVWNGRPLSEWLAAYDSRLRFDEGDGRRSQLSDEEIEQALDGIGSAALPFLRQWLTAKASRGKMYVNLLLSYQSLTSFRCEQPNWQGVALTGFMAYGADAQPLLPELIELSRSKDFENRVLAYEAAFFTLPPREIFLPLVTRALEEQDAGVRAMATQWLVERFPTDAEQIELNESVPAQGGDASNGQP